MRLLHLNIFQGPVNVARSWYSNSITWPVLSAYSTNKCQCMMHMKTGLRVKVAAGNNNAVMSFRGETCCSPPLCSTAHVPEEAPVTHRNTQDGAAEERGERRLFTSPCILLARLDKSLNGVRTALMSYIERSLCKLQLCDWPLNSCLGAGEDWPVGSRHLCCLM